MEKQQNYRLLLEIRQLWNERFGGKTKLTKKAFKQYMFDIGSMVKNEAN